MDERKCRLESSQIKTVTSGNAFRHAFSLIALFFLILSCDNAQAESTRQKLELLGYDKEDITDIMSGRKIRSQVDLKLKLKIQGYTEKEIRDLISAPENRSVPHGHDAVWHQNPGFCNKDGLVGEVSPYLPIIQKAATKNDVSPNLVLAIIKVESAFDHKAVSPRGAKGLMQLMPNTASVLGVTNPFDPRQNVYGGTRYFSNCLKTFNDIELALAAYNAGPTLVSRLKRVPEIRETQHFVRDVLKYEKVYDLLIRQN